MSHAGEVGSSTNNVLSSAGELLKQHRRRVAANTVMPSATATQREVVLHKFSDEELIARAKRASTSTLKRMKTRASAAVVDAQVSGCNLWDLVDMRSGNYNSWYTFKAGVQRYLEDDLAEAKQRLERLVSIGSPSSNSRSFQEEMADLESRVRLLSDLLRGVPADVPDRFRGDGRKKRYARKSKSRSIKTVAEDWREMAACAMPGGLKLLFLLQCVTGCRPQELENGVQARRCRDGTIVTRVKGAKCDDFAGQPSRSLRLVPVAGVTLMLAGLLQVGRTLDSRRCGLGRVNTYAKKVSRICAHVFPERHGKHRLSPYSVRHQFKADLVAGGWGKSEIAMAMGHSTTRSGTAYGFGGRGGGGAVKPIAVKAQRPVKLRGESPMARSGPPIHHSGAVNASVAKRKRPKF